VSVFGEGEQPGLSLEQLLYYYSRTEFILYFSLLTAIIVVQVITARYIEAFSLNPYKYSNKFLHKFSKKSITRLAGISYAVTGGTISSETLVNNLN
jgi:hypothetical protein